MSYPSIESNSEGSDDSLESGCLDSGMVNHSQISSKLKRVRDQFRAWIFHYTIQTDLLGEEGVSTDEKKCMLAEHLRTRLGHNRPKAVSSVTVFCDFSLVLVPPTDISPLVSVPIVGFVQSESRTVHTIIPWFPDAKWAPVPGGLADHPDFLRYMSLVENTAGPWFKLSVFGELGLNNAGRRAARENRKVFLKPFIHFLARPSD